MKKRISLILIISSVVMFWSCDVLKSYNGELLSLKDCPQQIDGMSVDLQRKEDYVFHEIVEKVLITYNGSVSECNLKRWTKTNWYGDVDPGYGNYYFVDANYDGNLDVFFGGGKSDRSYLAVWNPENDSFELNESTSLRCSLFSPSEDAIYKLASYDRNLFYYTYLKLKWVDGVLGPVESLCEVLTDEGGNVNEVSKRENEKITHKYAIFSYDPKTQNRTELKEEFDDFNTLPNNWKDVIIKMKKDYSIDKLLKEKPERIKRKEIVMKSVEYNSSLLWYYQSKTDEAWIDMGVVADDSTQLLWAAGDLILRNDNTIGISKYASYGSSFGWGDVSGRANETSSEFKFYGGENPPNSIEGNPQYDIVSAYFGTATRLPTITEWARLIENCNRRFVTIYRELPPVGEDGLPSWVQGQWMTEMTIGKSNIAVSIKIDGIGGSIICVQGGVVAPLFDGVFDYDRYSGTLKMGNIQLHVNPDTQTILTDDGRVLQKISNDTDSRKVHGLMLTSKINGQKLFFPVDYDVEYWSGTVADEDVECAYLLYVKASNPVNVAIGYGKRNQTKKIRPVSSEVIPITVGFAKK